MAVQMGTGYCVGSFRRKRARFSIFLATSVALITPGVAHAQSPGMLATEQADLSFSIDAQPLSQAVRSFSRVSGWQIGYPAGLLDDRLSKPITGRMPAATALQAMLAGSGLSVRMTGPSTATLFDERSDAAESGADDVNALKPIVLHAQSGGVHLGGDDVSDTGTTTLSGSQIGVRSTGNDANDMLRNMPNVQYQNDLDDDAGVTDQSVIDTKPREVSISGARVYENNFILNGMPINTMTGTSESSDDQLEDGLTPPNYDAIAGLHSQSVYVPTDFVESATVIDSNASARYGNFQGGVVSYKLQEAAKDRWS